MVTTRPCKTWWLLVCVRCGRRYAAAKRHAQTCSVRCRVALHRSHSTYYDPAPVCLGVSSRKPTPEEWAEMAGLRRAVTRPPAAELVAELPDQAELVAELPDQAELVAELPDQAELPLRPPTVALLVDCRNVLGITVLPVDRRTYEIARKRVCNLLAAKRRTDEQRNAIVASWNYVKAHSLYKPEVRCRP